MSTGRKENNKPKLKLSARIFLACLLSMIFALIIQTWLSYRSSSQIIYQQAVEISSNTLRNLQNELNDFNKSIENSLIRIYNQNEFLRDLSEGSSADQLAQNYQQLAYIQAHESFEPGQNLCTLYLYTINSELISSYRHAQTPSYSYPPDALNAMDEYEDRILQDYLASDSRGILISSVYNDVRDLRLIRYVLKISPRGQCCGYLIADIDPRPFRQFIEKYQFSDREILWLQSQDGQIALTSENAVTNDAFINFYDDGNGIHNEDTSRTKNNYEFFMTDNARYGMSVYMLYPQELLVLNQQALLRNTIFVLSLLTLVFILLFILISRGLTKPLSYMMESIKKIKEGETDLRLKPMRKDEIGILADEFNKMLDEISTLAKKEYYYQLYLRDMKYKALQAQVNPHFLYNTLDTVGSIASSYNCYPIESVTRALSHMFRYSLNMESPFSNLENEILHLKNYMFIMNTRMGNSLNLQIEIDPDLLKYKIPRLSIQPLVENAIKHGLKDVKGEKKIVIGSNIKNGFLEIWVQDNGVGMHAEDIYERLKQAPDGVLSKKASIGIENINARVKLLFGDAYGVRVESKINKGSKVTLYLPYEEHEEDSNGSSI